MAVRWIPQKYSKSGLNLTVGFEGYKSVAYWDPLAKLWTIAYGHTRGVVEGMTCTPEQGLAWALEDVQYVVDWLNGLHLTLTQGEFDALVDFGFNCGIGNEEHSTLLELVKQGKFDEAAEQFPRWDRAGGHEVAGLLRRRLAEQKEFLGD